MKKQLLFAAAMTIAITGATAQVVLDTVSLGSGYANQIWYSLPDDEQGSQAKNNWDLAFRTSGSMGSSIMVNHSNGGALWAYPKADKAGWATVDTNGLSTWPAQYNMETKWTGALGRYADISNPYDLGWGIYDLGTHYVIGDSIYILKTQTGAFKKLVINRLASGTYTFTYANLNGTDSTTSTIAKSAYSTKNFGYFNLDTKMAIDREPAKDNWDLVFGQYSTGDYATTMGIAGYTVTGILVNDTLQIAKAKVDPATRATYNTYSAHSFSNAINEIGYNWKSYDGATMTYKLNDSAVYFVRRNNGDIWKLILTGFASSTGSTMFSKEKIFTATSINESVDKSHATVIVSPNPAYGSQNVNIVYHFDEKVSDAMINIYDLSGRVVLTAPLENSAGLHAYTIYGNALNSGVYILSVVADNHKMQQKLIIQ
jgi:hypothetical protein